MINRLENLEKKIQYKPYYKPTQVNGLNKLRRKENYGEGTRQIDFVTLEEKVPIKLGVI